MKKTILTFSLLFTLCMARAGIYENTSKGIDPSTKSNGTIVYVTSAGAGTSDGSSWENATSDLQAAINMNETAEVWVAAGTYMPHDYPADVTFNNQYYDSTRCFSFYMKNNVAIYGGFIGTESLLNERNWETNITTLSGDLGVVGDSSDNTFRVIYNTTLDTTAVLDGFSITNGFCDYGISGAGMVNNDASPSILNCNFTKNLKVTLHTSDADGGALSYKGAAYIKVINCQFNQNFAASDGGAIYAEDVKTPSIIENCTFDNNSSARGGAISCTGDSIIINNCEFTGNTVAGDASTTGEGGALYNNAMVIVKNCLFTNNVAQKAGGAVSNFGVNGSYINCIFIGNNSSNNGGSGGGAYFKDATTKVKVTNCTFVKNIGYGIQGIGKISLINSILWHNGCIDNDKVFWGNGNDLSGVEIVGTLNNVKYEQEKSVAFDPQFADSAFHLKIGSPCRNAGNSNLYTDAGGDSLDFDGRPRIADLEIDMGAHERQPLCVSSEGVIYVKADADPLGTGESWENATNDLKYATELFDSVEVWIAGGTYIPNINQILPVLSVDDSTELRLEHFTMKKNVTWHGGFVGNESADYYLNERDLIENETILSGNINNKENHEDNCYHVISNNDVKLDSTAIIEGVTISDGYASADKNSLEYPDFFNGGGIFQVDSSQIINCIFRNNYASIDGAAIYIRYDQCKIIDCTFENNISKYGGVVYNFSAANMGSEIINCSFKNNSSDGLVNNGGAPYIENCSFISNENSGIVNWPDVDNSRYPSPTINNCVFHNNTETGIINIQGNPKITNCVFTKNGDHGMINYKDSPIITNCTFTKNKVSGTNKKGAGLNLNYLTDEQANYPIVRNCIIWGNGIQEKNFYVVNKDSINSNDIYDGSTDLNNYGNFSSDPLFVSTDSATFDVSLATGSPAINAGNDAYFDSTFCNPVDILGNNRKFGRIDLGAYELVDETTYIVTFEITNGGTPVTGAIITFNGVISAVDDYVIEDVNAGTYAYTINKDGYSQITGEVVVVDSDLTKEVTLEKIPDVYTVTFEINDGDTPVSGAIITFNGVASAANDYVIEDVEAGTYSYLIDKDGYDQISRAVIVDSDLTVKIDYSDTKVYTVTFEITNSGTPVTGAIITFNGVALAVDDYVVEDVKAGTYSYLIDKDGYDQISGTVNVDSDITEKNELVLVGINTLNTSEISIYPNPFNTVVNVTNADEVNRIVISDQLGRTVISIDNNHNSNVTINTDQLKNGMYFITVYENNKLCSTIKLFK